MYEKVLKTLLKYPGSKWRIASWIIEHFPEHKVYLEPFFGSGAVFFLKQPSYIETINDIDGNVINLFRVCRENPEKLAAQLNLTPFSREEFVSCYEIEVSDPVERARRTIVRYHQSFGTSNSTKNCWRNVQTAGGPRCATMWNYLPQSVIETCERLKCAQIENLEAVSLIERFNDPDVLIYCDPPYLQSLRKRSMYANEMNEEDHRKLLETILKSKAKIIISGYDSDLYNNMLCNWETDEIDALAQFGLHRKEKIWMNFIADKQYRIDILSEHTQDRSVV